VNLKNIILILIVSIQLMFGQKEIIPSQETAWLKRPFPQSNEKFTFAILGDKTTGSEEGWPFFDRAVEEINRLRPDFVIMVGDLIQGYVSDSNIVSKMWQEFTTHAQRLEVPLFVLPGNHDISNEMMYDYWDKHVGLRYYSFVYQNSLFLLLNTEEYKKTREGQLGKVQLDFIKKQLKIHKKVNHIFFFMHKPMWRINDIEDEAMGEWPQVLSWLKGKNATIFAGHKHELLYQKIKGYRHILHSATGGRLDPKNVPELGDFHQFSMVTVEPDTAVIAFIKPGNIFPENVANQEFINKVKKIVVSESDVSIDRDNKTLKATINIELKNPLEQEIQANIKINLDSGSGWKFDHEAVSVDLQPGTSQKISFSGTCKLATSIPFPEAESIIKLKNEILAENKTHFIPGKNAGWSSPAEVLVLGAFDLGIEKKPRTQEDLIAIDPVLIQPFGPELKLTLNEKYQTSDGTTIWQELNIQDGKIDFDTYFEDKDFSCGFVYFSIHSPDDRLVLGSIRPDNFCKIYLNNQTVQEGFPFRGVPNSPYIFLLPIKKGKNDILLKTADYYGNWYSVFKLIDPDGKLTFNSEMKKLMKGN